MTIDPINIFLAIGIIVLVYVIGVAQGYSVGYLHGKNEKEDDK